MKLNSAAFKEFFLNHGEKLVFAAVATVLVGGAYSLVAHETYQKDPESLIKNSEAAIKYVHDQTWNAEREHVIVVDPNKLVQEGSIALKTEEWRVRNPWYRTGTGIGRARSAPQVLAALDLEVDASFGPIAISSDKGGKQRGGMPAAGRDAPAQPAPGAAPAAPLAGNKPKKENPKKPATNKKDDNKPANPKPMVAGMGAKKKKLPGVQVSAETKIQGLHWVSLRAVVPAKSQSAEYASVFQGARWTDEHDDQVRYTDFKVQRALVAPDDPNAPPKWEDLDIKKAYSNFERQFPVFAQEVVDEAFLDEILTKPLPPLLAREWGREAAHKQFPVLKQEQEEAEAAAQDEEEGNEPTEDEDNPQDDGPAPVAVQPMKRPGGKAPVAAGPAGMSAAKAHGTGHAPNADFLFRFFDFTVKPHERYRYRIALVLYNPNHKVPERHLQSPDLKIDSTLTSPWSQPSLVVEIPGERSWLVGPAKAGQSTVEPSVQATVVVLDKKRGIEVAHDAKTVRGQPIDFPKMEVAFINPKTGLGEKDVFDFLAGAVLVDFKGGTSMPAPGRAKREAEPSDAIYLTEDGRLVTHSELLDRIRYDEFRSIHEEAGGNEEKAKKEEKAEPNNNPFPLMPAPPTQKKKK